MSTQCISPFVNEGQSLPCGKCFNCKKRRTSGWSFRLNKEAEVSTSAFFVTLSYEQPHLTKNGFMNLCKQDLQKYLKRLRKLNDNKLKYYAVGEYGGKFNRPHYHIIIFNALETTLEKAWKGYTSIDEKSPHARKNTAKNGYTHVGTCTPASVAYTLEYISKGGQVPKHAQDDRQKEFSLMSKGLGKNYLTENMKNWHKDILSERMYCSTWDGKKLAMPRYYKEKIYTKAQRLHISMKVQKKQKEEWDNMSYRQQQEKENQEYLINIEKCRKLARKKDNNLNQKF